MSRFQKRVFIGALSALFLLPAVSFAAGAGKITKAVPNAQVIKSTGNVAAAVGGEIQSGDAISTGAGQVQFTLSDQSKFAVPASSMFKIDEYAEKSATAGGRALYTLQEGAFRTVSGLVGKSAGDAYKVTTSIATIEILGTDYAALLKKDGTQQDGLYVMVYAGKVRVTNKAGSIDVSAGEIVYIKDENTKPEFADDGARLYFQLAGINPGANFNLTLSPTLPGTGQPPAVVLPPTIPTPVIPKPETPASPS